MWVRAQGDLHKSNAYKAARSPYEEHLALEVRTILIDHVRCGVCDGPVEKPVGCGGHGQALGTCLERVQLSGDHPCYWTPGAGEEEDVDAHERDGRALGWEVGCSGDGTNDGYNI